MATDSVAPRNRRGGRRTPLTQEQRDTVLRLLTETPELSDGQIGLQAGVSPAKVWQLRTNKRRTESPEPEGADEAQAELARLIGKNLPLLERVRVLTDIARDRKAAGSVRLRAFELANEFQGMLTRKQQRDAEANSSQPAPIFVFTGMAPSAAPPQVVDQGQDKPALPSISKPELDKSTG